MAPKQKRLIGIVLAAGGGVLLLALLAFGVFDIYVIIEDRGSDAEVAWPLLAGTCCCSLVSLGIVGTGIYLLMAARRDNPGMPESGV